MAVSVQIEIGFVCWYCGAFLIVELALGVYKKVVYNFLIFLKKSRTTFIVHLEL